MIRIILAAALALGVIGAAQAQTGTLTSASGSSAGAVLQQQNIIPGGGGGSSVGGTVWTMGQTTGGNNVTSYDACLKYINATGLFVNIGIPLEIAHCWALRSMDAMAKFPPGSIQYEYGCQDSNWAKVDWDTGTVACTSNKARMRKENPADPRGQAMAYVPVVQAGHGANTGSIVAMNQPAPPTVVHVRAPDAPVTISAAPGLPATCRPVGNTGFVTC